MLSHLRQRAELILEQTQQAMLSTYGPADIQTDEFHIVARGLTIYLLLPNSSDHLYNLESHGTVVLSTPCFHLRGYARLLPADEYPSGMSPALDEGPWHVWVEIHPTRLQVLGPDGAHIETLDMEEASNVTA